uniref:Uncharacterized protein n=1 Tax=Magallana gigas TaxID=29159 RepID=K1Q4A2_MAGGI
MAGKWIENIEEIGADISTPIVAPPYPPPPPVCSDHFPEGNGRTWNNQVPTLFLPHKTVKSVKVRLSTNSNKMNIESPAQAVDVNDHKKYIISSPFRNMVISGQ